MTGTFASPVRTDELRAALRGLFAAVAAEGRASLQRFSAAVVEPLARLAGIAALADRASSCDRRAERTLRRMLNELGPLAEAAEIARLESNGQEFRRGDAAPGFRVVDQPAVSGLALSLAAIGLDSEVAGSVYSPEVLVPLITGARVAEAVVDAHRRGGVRGATQQLLSGQMLGLPPDLQTLIDGLSFPGLDLPDFDGQRVDLPESDLDWVDDLFERFKNPFDRPEPDTDVWEPVPPWWYHHPVGYLPPGFVQLMRCITRVKELIADRAAIPPPPVPLDTPHGVTWADPITSLSSTARCPGDVLRVFGSEMRSLRGIAVVMVPTESGCRPVSTSLVDWRDTEIRVVLPPDVTSGPVGFADASYVAAHNAWHEDQERRLKEIRSHSCAVFAGNVVSTEPFSMCAPNLGVNYLTAGAAIIDYFTAAGRPRLVVPLGGMFSLAWKARNCTGVEVTRTSPSGPTFHGSTSHIAGPTGSITVGPFTASSPEDAVYVLTATGPCGARTATVTVVVRRTPILRVTGVELTQGIQTSDSPDASMPLVAHKDTIARVYVSHDLSTFKLDATNAVAVSGRMRIRDLSIAPLNVAAARPEGAHNRALTDDTLNFRIPAGHAHGAPGLDLAIWTTLEFEQPPDGEPRRPRATGSAAATWVHRRTLKLRYVRISTSTSPATSTEDCQELVVRAHDLLPAAPLDIAEAWMPSWHTSHNPNTREGKQKVLDHLADQHDCTLSEAIFPWEDDCPDDDGAIWVGVLPGDGGGVAQGHRFFTPGRNTLVAQVDRVVLAHEIGHTQKLNHVNPGLSCGTAPGPDGDYDTLHIGGMIYPGDAFDPYHGIVIPFGFGLYDMMTYACNRWISPSNWRRLFDKFA